MTATAPAPATSNLRSTQLPCPCCGESRANISINLWTLDDEGAFTCTECDAEFSAADVRGFIAKWTRLLGWLEQVPQMDDE